MRREVTLCGHRNGFWVEIIDRPGWVVAKENIWDKLCTWTGGWLGGHGLPDLFWKIPVGRAKWDHDDPNDPMLINNVAWMMCDLEQWVLNLGDDRRVRDAVVATIPVDIHTARKLDPALVEILTDDEEDDHV